MNNLPARNTGNGVDNLKQALMAVRGMRYPPRKRAAYTNPPGLAHKVACGLNPLQAQDIPKRIEQGWKYLEIGNAGGGLTPATNDALKSARGAMK